MSMQRVCLVSWEFVMCTETPALVSSRPNQSASAYVARGFMFDAGVAQTFAVVDRGFCKYV